VQIRCKSGVNQDAPGPGSLRSAQGLAAGDAQAGAGGVEGKGGRGSRRRSLSAGALDPSLKALQGDSDGGEIFPAGGFFAARAGQPTMGRTQRSMPAGTPRRTDAPVLNLNSRCPQGVTGRPSGRPSGRVCKPLEPRCITPARENEGPFGLVAATARRHPEVEAPPPLPRRRLRQPIPRPVRVGSQRAARCRCRDRRGGAPTGHRARGITHEPAPHRRAVWSFHRRVRPSPTSTPARN
jgi:hypothetical protein